MLTRLSYDVWIDWERVCVVRRDFSSAIAWAIWTQDNNSPHLFHRDTDEDKAINEYMNSLTHKDAEGEK